MDSITRQVDLDLDAAQLWETISDPEQLAAWLGDDVDVAMRPGEFGTITDDGIVRNVRVDEVVAERQVAFTWWDPTDPARRSQVVFEVTSTSTGSRLTIIETLPAPDAADAQARWEIRVLCLWACTVAAALAQ
jgi:uncharacterized protein YndB with AHSA1/START domain